MSKVKREFRGFKRVERVLTGSERVIFSNLFKPFLSPIDKNGVSPKTYPDSLSNGSDPIKTKKIYSHV